MLISVRTKYRPSVINTFSGVDVYGYAGNLGISTSLQGHSLLLSFSINFVFIFRYRPVVRQILNISRLVVNHIWQSLIVLAQSRMATLILRRHQSYTRQIKPYANLRFSKRFQPLGKEYWHILYVICAQEFMK
mgnify:CR=1 FL=1